MKRNLLLMLVVLMTAGLLRAQVPQAINYQAVLRNSSGVILANQSVGLRIKLLQGSVSGTTVYTETFTKTTTALGLVNLEIGKGTSTDNFSAMNWANGPYFVEVAADATGGTTYVVMGTSQLLSVPYAMYSKNAGSALNDKDTSSTNELQSLYIVGDSIKATGAAYGVDLAPYKRLTETEVDAMAENNGYTKALSGITVKNYKGSWLGTGSGDSVIIAAMPSHTTYNFDVVLSAHDVNSNTNYKNLHKEFIAYRNWTYAPVVQDLITHYDASTGITVSVVFDTNSNNEIYCRIKQTGGSYTNMIYNLLVRVISAN